jgi:hypothetical protein
MKFLFLLAVLYFALPSFSPESTPAIVSKAAQEKAIHDFASSVAERIGSAMTAAVDRALHHHPSIALPQVSDAHSRRGLVALEVRCQSEHVEGEDIYDYERSITMLYKVMPTIEEALAA